MKKAFLVPALVVLAILLVYLYSNYSFLFQPITTAECAKDDAGCIKNAESDRIACIPSSTVINGKDGIILMVNTTREGDKCIRTEEVIGSENLTTDYLVGRNITCSYELSQLGNASATACPGSLYDYVKPSSGGGGQTQTAQGGIPKINCGIDDYTCKDIMADYIKSCLDSEIVTVELKWEPSGYWTALIRIKRLADVCQIYFEAINAINLPPGIPSTFVGSSMTCNIPLSEFPPENLSASWCAGELYNYIKELSY